MSSTTYLSISVKIKKKIFHYEKIIILLLLYVLTTAVTTQNLMENQNQTTTNLHGNKLIVLKDATTFYSNDSQSMLRKKKKKKKKRLRPSMKVNYHGYEGVPPEAWKQWMEEWRQKEMAKDDLDEDYYDGRLPDWTGHAIDGVDPPPWAIMPATFDKKTNYTSVYYGRPGYCFLSLERGQCNLNITRWGFVPHKRRCEKFNYSGCGENSNNFLSKTNCDKQCGTTPKSCCGGIYNN